MPRTLRQLVACPGCSLQYDATELAPGDRFHCGCGELVRVPEVRAHEAAVVRCSSCGGPRQDGATKCTFCDSAFTLHERDLHTICPRCTARISDRARYCHACGMTIAPQASAGSRTEFACPACTNGHKLQSRPLDRRELSVLECGSCAGLWVGNEVFERLAANAEEVRAAVAALGAGNPAAALPIAPIDAEQRLYRPCPICGSLMHRRNYGRKSGVIVDTCRGHGVWFDDGELARILGWLQSGGARRANLEVDLERRRVDRHTGLYGPKAEPPVLARERRTLADVVAPVIDFLGHFI